jgi:hypothetical protein
MITGGQVWWHMPMGSDGGDLRDHSYIVQAKRKMLVTLHLND